MILAELLQGRHSHGLRRNPWKMEAKENPVLLCSVAPSVAERGHRAVTRAATLCDTQFTSQSGYPEILAELGDFQPFQG